MAGRACRDQPYTGGALLSRINVHSHDFAALDCAAAKLGQRKLRITVRALHRLGLLPAESFDKVFQALLLWLGHFPEP